MTALRITIVGDGSSDANLQPIIDWLIKDRFPMCAYEIAYAHQLRTDGMSLQKRMSAAFALYPCDVLIVHRDAERVDIAARQKEIEKAAVAEDLGLPIVALVPIKMTEAWLLFDEAAIRSAAGNPNGKVALKLPRPKDVEKISDAKTLIFDALKTASELNGRRLENFNVRQARNRVAGLIKDFSSLRHLSAFSQFESRFTVAIEALI
ncbi:hypothetical protein [Cupriavidus campinensis]